MIKNIAENYKIINLHSLVLIFLSLYLSGCNISGSSTDPGSSTPVSESPYITQIFDYCYGAGQHAARALPADSEKFIGTDSDYILLGGWGGYITAGFDHNIINNDGDDFAVYTQPGYGNEPAVVYVMDDTNTNGLPDDTWYELSGSDTDADYSAGETYSYGEDNEVEIAADPLNKYVRNYELTYYKADLTLEDNNPEYGNITWSDNQENSGILISMYGSDTSELWWWYGEDVESKTFKGVKLPYNKFTINGTSWQDFEDRLNWGYAENYSENGAEDCKSVTFGSETRLANCLDISNAVDQDGEPYHLDKIRFIKVQTGVFLQAGQLNEVSAEISGAVDLHSREITTE